MTNVPKPPKITKVKPYPIPAQLKDSRGAHAGLIMRLTIQGLMVEVSSTALQPGEKVEITFVTPLQKGAVAIAGVVIKVYNQLTAFTSGVGAASTSRPPPATSAPTGHSSSSSSPSSSPVVSPSGSGAISLIEIHYTSVLPESMNSIAMFLEATGQAKRG